MKNALLRRLVVSLQTCQMHTAITTSIDRANPPRAKNGPAHIAVISVEAIVLPVKKTHVYNLHVALGTGHVI